MVRKFSECCAAGALYTLINVLTYSAWMFSCFYRGKIRAQYNIRGWAGNAERQQTQGGVAMGACSSRPRWHDPIRFIFFM
ncbi:predicted protein [Arabidopsis lyrata subsp. lyrata]|uniref:Predicted protein n=1 Tax=Arabidopsis lyrata subsp. lyrata TaxID=81972 RepID=D7KCK6_ARALL|nr:predicted protein [Arabidopsis lyrata subsp. lyrata]